MSEQTPMGALLELRKREVAASAAKVNYKAEAHELFRPFSDHLFATCKGFRTLEPTAAVNTSAGGWDEGPDGTCKDTFDFVIRPRLRVTFRVEIKGKKLKINDQEFVDFSEEEVKGFLDREITKTLDAA